MAPRRMLVGFATLALVALLASCSSTTPPTGTTAFVLPTVPSVDGPCAGIGIIATLEGAPTDPRLAWLVQPSGKRLDVVWPPGFTARFSPNLEILDAAGNVVLRAGDPVDGGCTGDPYLLIEPGG